MQWHIPAADTCSHWSFRSTTMWKACRGCSAELEAFSERLPDELEVVFVVDGATDGSDRYLQEHLPTWRVASRLIELSRNFGSFAAIAGGLERRVGMYIAVMAADLQEPVDSILEFHRLLAAGEADVVVWRAQAAGRSFLSRLLSEMFWSLYRRFVVSDMPQGGVDVFGCTRQVRDRLLGAERVTHQPHCAPVLARLPARVRPLRPAGATRRTQRMDVRAQTSLRPRQRLQLHRPADSCAAPARSGGHGIRGRRGGHGLRDVDARTDPGARLHAADAGHHVLRRPDGARPRHHRPIPVAVAAERAPPAELHCQDVDRIRPVSAGRWSRNSS